MTDAVSGGRHAAGTLLGPVRRMVASLRRVIPEKTTLGTTVLAALAFWVLLGGSAGAAEIYVVSEQNIDDQKAVFATVRSTDKVTARARIAGTVAKLNVDEGSQVAAGQILAIIADQKLVLRVRESDAQINAFKSRVSTARSNLARAMELKKKGVVAQARIDQLQTVSDVAVNDLKAAEAARAVIERQLEEGEVLAPTSGRVLRVPITVGSVVLPGENLATIAGNRYILRLELPERHARFIGVGDPVRVGKRSLATSRQAPVSVGKIIQVYPELERGHVLADAEVAGLGDYFVGERALVWISAGKRRTIVIPRNYVFKRFGMDFVRLARGESPPIDIVVQLGRLAELGKAGDAVEVLAGLKPGDRLVRP